MLSKIFTNIHFPFTGQQDSFRSLECDHLFKRAMISCSSFFSACCHSASNRMEKLSIAAMDRTRAFFSTKQTWHTRLIEKLDVYDEKLEKWFRGKYPSIAKWQDRVDQFGNKIKSKASLIAQYNLWLRNDKSVGSLNKDISLYLVKLPLRTIQNIALIFYTVIKEVIFTIVHPLKSMIRTSKQIVIFAYDLTQPETWSKIGASIIGSEVAQILIFTNPILHMTIGIGVFILLGGLCVGAVRAAALSKSDGEEAANTYVLREAKLIPENFLTSFFMGIIIGSVEKFVGPKIGTPEDARIATEKYIQKHNLPSHMPKRHHRTLHTSQKVA